MEGAGWAFSEFACLVVLVKFLGVGVRLLHRRKPAKMLFGSTIFIHGFSIGYNTLSNHRWN